MYDVYTLLFVNVHNYMFIYHYCVLINHIP